MAKPTIKQKLAFKNLLVALKDKSPFELKEIMIEAGYSKATAHCPEKNLTSRDGWKTLLSRIDDEPLLSRLKEIAVDSDKRASISAIQELFKLKDKYPTGKLKITQYQQALDNLEDEA